MMIFNHCYKLRNLILAAFLTIGFASPVLAQQHALFVDLNSKEATDLGTLGGNFSTAHGINDAGQVVGVSGVSRTDTGQGHAFITGPNGVGMRDLGTLGGDDSWAYGINDAGQVVGDSLTASGKLHAFITGPDGLGMTDLGSLGGDSSVAYGINDAGEVVGTSNVTPGLWSSQRHAFITGPDGVGMTDLNSLVNVPDGVILTEATGINNSGQVIAIGVPEPESYLMLLVGLGLAGFMARGKPLLA
jgi:probable HAF family extracellular repeat protein